MLAECEKNKVYMVREFSGHAKEIEEKLNRVGLRVGVSVCVTNSNYGKNALLVKIQGVGFALDTKICKGVIVESA